ncbi:MAG: response regulator [Candidatus Sericytochromatia bacterium]
MSVNPSMKQHILIIEDSQTLGVLALSKFRESNLDYEPVLADSFAKTQELVESGQYNFVWALVDLSLPDAEGEEVIDYVAMRHIRPIVLTGAFGEEWRELLLAKNVVDYFIKNSRHDYDLIIEQIERLDNNRFTKVLIVDDSISYRAYLKRLLKIRNYDVIDASSGQLALEKLVEFPEIKLVITDYLMPEMDGIMLTQKIRSRYKPSQVAILGISASDDLVLSARFLKAGASDYLRKPFSIEEFNCRVSQNIHQMQQFDLIQKSLDLKNHFLGMAAHDIRSPVGNIYSFCQLFLRGTIGNLSQEQMKVILNMKDMTMHTLQLLNDLLDMSAIEHGSLNLRQKPAAVLSLLRQRIEMQRLYAQEKNIQVILEEDPNLILFCDPQRFGQVLDNLVSNAIKYSYPGSRVWLRSRTENQQVVLEIEDEGQGLSPEDQLRLFTPFERLRSKPTAGERSTGLGLVIARKIVDAHGGTMECVSELGKGTTFRIRMPKFVEETVPVAS